MIETIKTTSWVVVNKTTRTAIFETFKQNVAKAINTEKYEALPIEDYLIELNTRIQVEGKTS